MPKCSSCGNNHDNPSVMELVRSQDNHWVSICRFCLDRGVDVNKVKPGYIAVDQIAIAAADKPAINITTSKNFIEDAKKLLEALRSLRQNKERLGRARSYERKRIDLIVRFSLARDDSRHEGTVKDFSQSGIRFVTTHPLTKGQVVQFDWNVPLPLAITKVLQSTAEVRRVIKNDSGQYDVGCKFLARQSDKGANRRRFRRYKCDMLMYYQRKGSAFMSWGKATDISQGGCQTQFDEKLDAGEVFEVRLIGGGGNRVDLVGSMRVCRVSPREVGFETGCAFEKMRMEQQSGAAPATKTPP